MSLRNCNPVSNGFYSEKAAGKVPSLLKSMDSVGIEAEDFPACPVSGREPRTRYLMRRPMHMERSVLSEWQWEVAGQIPFNHGLTETSTKLRR